MPSPACFARRLSGTWRRWRWRTRIFYGSSFGQADGQLQGQTTCPGRSVSRIASRRSVGAGGTQRLRKEFFGAGDPWAAQPERRQGAWFDSVGRPRVISAERKRVAQTAGQSDFLCAAKPHVSVESGVAAGHTAE